MTTSMADTRSADRPEYADRDDSAQPEVVVYNCSRLGMRANPPRSAFAEFFRFGRRR